MYGTLIVAEHDDGYGNESTVIIQCGSHLLWEEVFQMELQMPNVFQDIRECEGVEAT